MSKKKSASPRDEAKEPVKASMPQSSPAGESALAARLSGKELYLLMGAIALGCFIVFKDFLSFEKVYLFKDIGSDSINIYFPGLVQQGEYIKANGIPTWTFSQGLGQNMFPLWLGDIFSNIVMLLFSKEKLPYTLAWIEVIKVLLNGWVFYKLLLELKLHKYAACIGAFLFAFSGYIILGGCWTIFSLEALYITLILYGFERWLNKGKWLWFVVGLTCMSFLQPFFLFPYAIFLAVYMPVRYFDVHDGVWNKFPVFFGKTLGLAVLGVAISAYQLFPDLLQYIESPRVGGEAQLITKLKAQPIFGLTDEWLRFTTTFRAFGSDMLGSGSAFQGWQNYLEAPLFYCGILCLVTFPQAFAGMDKRRRIAYGILAGIFALPIFFPFFRYSFWAYTGDYFRTYSLVVTLLLLLFTAKGLNYIITEGRVNLIILGVTVAFLLFLLYTPSDQFAPAINSGLRSFATMLIFVYGILLYGLTTKAEFRNISRVALLVVCFFEMIYFSSQTVNERDVMTASELTDRVGYNDYTVDAVRSIKQRDHSFYRINKDYSSGMAIHQSINDAKVQGYYGSQSYFSFNQKNYIRFLGELNVLNPKDENATRWAMGVSGRPLLFSLVGGKYWLVRRPETHVETFGYDQIGQYGNVKVYQNRYALPLAFAYDTVLENDRFKTLSTFQKDLYLLKGCVVDSGDADLLSYGKAFNMADTATPFSVEQYGRYVEVLRKDTLAITQFKESDIKGTINLSAPKILFFSIPYDEGWHATLNGAEAKIYRVNVGFVGVKVGAGKNDVELRFEPRYMMKGAMVSIIALLAFCGLLLLSAKKGNEIN
jgi:uncharacterized membrane protein YfhO